jgi:hypothetical protein
MSRLATPDRIAGCAMSAAAFGGGTPLAMTASEGCIVTAHAAAGVYQITLDTQVDSSEAFIFVTPRSATPRMASVEHTSDLVKTVHLADDAGAAVDDAFDFAVFRKT